VIEEGEHAMPIYKPEGWPTVVPRLLTPDVQGLAAFIKAVFEADGEVHPNRPSEIRIGESLIMVSDGDGRREAHAGFLYVYVPDADETYDRAVAAGAEIIEAPLNQAYGDRRATFSDKWGNTWQAATRQL
jgi:uncharacterized glyoxalase superfamily protein PhnB